MPEHHTPLNQPAAARQPQPTPSQLRYLRTLAMQTRTPFTPPRTRRQASQEIMRLRDHRAQRETSQFLDLNY